MKCKNCPALDKGEHFCRDCQRKISWLTLFLRKKPHWCKRKYYPRYHRCSYNRNKPLRG